jgi:hypothetical protein
MWGARAWLASCSSTLRHSISITSPTQAYHAPSARVKGGMGSSGGSGDGEVALTHAPIAEEDEEDADALWAKAASEARSSLARTSAPSLATPKPAGAPNLCRYGEVMEHVRCTIALTRQCCAQDVPLASLA